MLEQPDKLASMVFHLRALILALGETAQPAWWKTKFMNETGLRFLERLYPRTYFQAAVHATGKAACDIHDRAVGRVGVYHLFRLQESLEAEIGRMSPDTDQGFVTDLRVALFHPDMKSLLQMLTPLCSNLGAQDVSPGARRLGGDEELLSSSAFRKIAAVYYHAFRQGTPGFPYFVSQPARSLA